MPWVKAKAEGKQPVSWLPASTAALFQAWSASMARWVKKAMSGEVVSLEFRILTAASASGMSQY